MDLYTILGLLALAAIIAVFAWVVRLQHRRDRNAVEDEYGAGDPDERTARRLEMHFLDEVEIDTHMRVTGAPEEHLVIKHVEDGLDLYFPSSPLSPRIYIREGTPSKAEYGRREYAYAGIIEETGEAVYKMVEPFLYHDVSIQLTKKEVTLYIAPDEYLATLDIWVGDCWKKQHIELRIKSRTTRHHRKLIAFLPKEEHEKAGCGDLDS